MIVEFSVTNFKCFREKTTISFIANTAVEGADIKPETLIEVKKFGIDYLVKSIVIYGANASGKSSVIEGFVNFLSVLDFSGNIQTAEQILPFYKPFLLSTETENAETEFEVKFLSQDKKRAFRYYFAFNKEIITKEEFFEFDEASEEDNKFTKLIFKRTSNIENFKGSHKDLIKFVKPNKLFIALLGIHNLEESNFIYNFFRSKLPFKQAVDLLEEKNEKFLMFFESLKNATDKTIKEHSIIKRPTKKHTFNIDTQTHKSSISYEDSEEKIIIFSRLKNDGELVKFNPEIESNGTIQMLYGWPSGLFFHTLIANLFSWSDEIDKSLHPLLLKHLFETFFAFKNEKGEKSTAQLLTTTHDVSLLDANIFRRDQIWFTEKYSNGESELFSLADFTFAKKLNGKNTDEYLRGVFGGIPRI